MSYNNNSDDLNINSIKNEKHTNYFEKDLSPNRPKYKKNIIQENVNSNKNKKSKNLNNIYKKKEINNNKSNRISPKKPIMKVLTIKNKDMNQNNSNDMIIDKRSNSSGGRSKRNYRNNNLSDLNKMDNKKK